MKTLPFYLLLITTFALAAIQKFPGTTPSWFLDQFRGSPMDLFPGSLATAFVLIALAELTTFGILLAGVLRLEFLPKRPKPLLSKGLFLAQLTFVALAFGQRLTHRYESAAFLFCLAALTFLAGRAALADD